jgi:hypothetical protein
VFEGQTFIAGAQVQQAENIFSGSYVEFNSPSTTHAAASLSAVI